MANNKNFDKKDYPFSPIQPSNHIPTELLTQTLFGVPYKIVNPDFEKYKSNQFDNYLYNNQSSSKDLSLWEQLLNSGLFKK